MSDMLNIMTTVNKSLSSESSTAISTTRRFTAISKHSLITGSPKSIQDWLMSLPQDSRASLFPWQENSVGQMMTETCGPKLSTSFAQYDRNTACWRTSQVCLLTLMPEEYSATWPKAGLMLDGVCYPQPNWVHRISEIESGLFATPTTTEGGRNKSASAGSKIRPSLGMMAKHNLWATSNTLDSLKPKSEKALRKEYTTARPGQSKPANLRDQVSNMNNWPTPTAHGNYNRKGISKTSGDGLATAVKMWPTPSATDYKGSGKTGTLRDRLDYATERGETKSKKYQKPETAGFLNPDWVEWLMGWPIGWTSLEPLNSDHYKSWINYPGWKADPAENDEIPRTTTIKSNRSNRIKALGNGQVPAVVKTAWELLIEDMTVTNVR